MDKQAYQHSPASHEFPVVTHAAICSEPDHCCPLHVTAGSARDHLLGFTAVSGRGETFVAGARVVKNVTGYDLPKLMAGSWGRIGAMTELTLKVLPRPRMAVTLAIEGLDCRAAHAE